MLSHLHLRGQLIRYLIQEISLDEFDQWFAEQSWNIHRSSDLMAQRLAYAVELRLAEYDSGHLPEKDLRDELLELVRVHSLNISLQVVSAVSGTSTVFSSQPWVIQSVDTLPSRAS